MSATYYTDKILAKLTGFSKACDLPGCGVAPADPHEDLGEFRGVYKNRDTSNGGVYVFDEGICSRRQGMKNVVRFADIVSVSLPEPKPGTYVDLTLRSGQSARIIIDAVDGKFSELYEFVRFLDRMIRESQE